VGCVMMVRCMMNAAMIAKCWRDIPMMMRNGTKHKVGKQNPGNEAPVVHNVPILYEKHKMKCSGMKVVMSTARIATEARQGMLL